MKRPMFYFTLGLPGAGKTTFAWQLARREHAIYIGADKTAIELYGLPRFSDEERVVVQKEMAYKALDSLRMGRNVIWDGMTASRSMRNVIYRIGQVADAIACGIWVQVPEEEALRRAQLIRIDQLVVRPRRVTKEQFETMKLRFEIPDASEPITNIPGDQPFAVQRTIIGDRSQKDIINPSNGK